MKLDVKNLSGKAVGSIELPEDLFAREVRKDLLQRTVKWQLAGARAGTAHTMTRGEVDRTKAKWFRQKGTGRARHGARSSNIFVGGGVVFGPRGRDFSHSLNKKMRALAIKTALSAKAAENQIVMIDELKMASGKTKDMVAALKALNISRATFIVDSLENGFDRATRNVPHLKVLPTEGANVYDILANETLVLTPAAVELLAIRLNTKKTDETVAPAAKKTTKKPAASKAEAK